MGSPKFWEESQMPYFLDSIHPIDDKTTHTYQLNDNFFWGGVIEWKWNFANEQKCFDLPPCSRNINMGLFYCLKKVETHHQGNMIF